MKMYKWKIRIYEYGQTMILKKKERGNIQGKSRRKMKKKR